MIDRLMGVDEIELERVVLAKGEGKRSAIVLDLHEGSKVGGGTGCNSARGAVLALVGIRSRRGSKYRRSTTQVGLVW